MTDVIYGVFEKDINVLSRKIGSVAGQMRWVQIDVADNTYVPIDLPHDFRLMAPTIDRYIKAGLSFEAHLMVSQPDRYLADLAAAGFSRVIAHVECDDPREFLSEARSYDMEVGMAIDAETEVEVIEPFLEEIDFVLVMTADAGSSGQAFQTETLEKIRMIHRAMPDLPIEVDCGMNPETAKIVRDVGVTRIVTTSYLEKNIDNIPQVIEDLSGERDESDVNEKEDEE